VAISPDGRSVYVTNLAGRSVSQYDADPRTGALTPKAPATVPTPPLPSGLAVAPDGRSLYVGALSGRVAQFDIDRRTGALAPKRPGVVRVGLGGLGGAGVAITPDGRYLYTPDSIANTVAQFAIGRGGRLSALRPGFVRSGTGPQGVAMAPDGRTLYATAAGDGTVWSFHIGATGRLAALGAPVSAGAGPHGVTVTPDQGPQARFSVRRSGAVVRLDGRASRDPDGRVRTYAWHFGDGHHASGATVTHRYVKPGRYRIRLVVTDDAGCSTRQIYTGQSALCNGSGRAIATRTVSAR
jgi:DNA-binding beta-propeller fold protein YncE